MRSNPVVGMGLGCSALGLGLSLLASCQASAGKSGAAVQEIAPSAPASVLPKDPIAPLDRIDESNFELVWTLLQAAADGKPGRGELVLVAKSPFKPNEEYPHKFKVKGNNVSLAKTEIGKSDMQVSVERVVVPVSFDVTGPNPTLEGTLAFSVCTAEACLIERKDIRLSVASPSGARADQAPPTVGAAPTTTAAPSGRK